MSKSLGNVIDPVKIRLEYGMEAFRYYLFREMVFGLDGVFSEETLETRYNADLANNLGNLVSRTLAMVHQYRGGVIPPASAGTDLELELRRNAESCVSEVVGSVESMELHRALERIWLLIDAANVFIDRTKPWVLAKEEKKLPEAKAQLDSSLYYQLETIRITALLLSGFMPETSAKILRFLNLEKEPATADRAVWGKLRPGELIQKGSSLFPRREKEKKESAKVNETASQEKSESAGGLISIDEFQRVKLCVGQIMAAEAVPKSEKLVKLQVDIGEPGGPRQILAGIAKHYTPESLIGRKVAVVKNLKPAKLMGNESQGMLLAASDDAGNLELVSIGPALAPGSGIR
jgi:methionyl-tRNA synthetase